MKRYSIYNFPHFIIKPDRIDFEDFFFEFDHVDIKNARYLRNKDKVKKRKKERDEKSKRVLRWLKTCSIVIKEVVPSKFSADPDNGNVYDICIILSFLTGGSVATDEFLDGYIPERIAGYNHLKRDGIISNVENIYTRVDLLIRTKLKEVFTNFILSNEQVQYLSTSVFLHSSFNYLYELVWERQYRKSQERVRIEQNKIKILNDLKQYFYKNVEKYNIEEGFIKKCKVQLKYEGEPSANTKILHFLQRIEILDEDLIEDEEILDRVRLLSQVRNVNFHEGTTNLRQLSKGVKVDEIMINIIVLDIIKSIIYYYFNRFVFRLDEIQYISDLYLLQEYFYEGKFQGDRIFYEDNEVLNV